MKVVVAMDSFKGSLDSMELAKIAENGIKKVYKDAVVEKVPVADGGEGTVEALVSGTGGKRVKVLVNGPLMDKIEAEYGILGDGRRAVIEMAKASGLPLVDKEKRNPMLTTTYGTGELIADALKRGCRQFIVGIGGSATNDAGMGMLQALGYKFYDKKGKEIGFGGQYLSDVVSFDDTEVVEGLKESKFLVACDVDNPFYGERGASYVYAPQKGADKKMVEVLDEGLKAFASFVKDKKGKEIDFMPGAGAAGGLGGGFVAFLDSELRPGIDIVLEAVKLDEIIRDADFVITGEGRIDFQSVMGKAPIGVSKIAKKYGIPCIALAGSVADDASAVHDYGIDSIFSVINYPLSLENAMEQERAAGFVEKNIEEIFRLIKVCESRFSL